MSLTVLPNANMKLDGTYLIAENITAIVTVTPKYLMDMPFADVIMVGVVISVKFMFQKNAKMGYIKMVAITVMRTFKAPGVTSRFHGQSVHAAVAMESVTWVQPMLTIIVNAIQVSPVQTAIQLLALVDVRANHVGLLIIMHTVTMIFQSRLEK